MRFSWLFLIMILATFTGVAFRPLLQPALGMADPLLIFVCWMALVDRWPRLLLMIVVVAAHRCLGGITTPVDAVVPLLCTVLTVRFLKTVFDPHHPYRRIQIILPSLLIGVSVQESMLSGVFPTFQMMFPALLLSAVVTAILLPVLDIVRPFLKSARYPL